MTPEPLNSLAALTQSSKLHTNGVPDLRHFNQAHNPAVTMVPHGLMAAPVPSLEAAMAGLAGPSGVAPRPPVPAPPAPQILPVPSSARNALAGLGAGVPPQALPGPPAPAAPGNPILAHVQASVHRLPHLSDQDLAQFRSHNATVSTALHAMLGKPVVAYVDAVRLLTALAQRGAMPVDQALQTASTLPTDPQQLRQVLVHLQMLAGHAGVMLQGEQQRRGMAQ